MSFITQFRAIEKDGKAHAVRHLMKKRIAHRCKTLRQRCVRVIAGGAFMCVILLGTLIPISVDAGPVIRSGDVISLGEDQKISGDFYIAGRSITISGTVEGDIYIAGGTVTINGEVKEDIVVVAGAVSIHSDVGDDVRIVAGQVVIANRVAGDVVVFGGSLSILSTAVVDGDVIFYGGRLDIEGAIGGSINSKADTLVIDSAVAGDVTVTIGDQLILGSQANIEGGVAYRSSKDMARDPGSVVVGEISKFSERRTQGVLPIIVFPFLPFFATLFAALVSILLFAKQIDSFIKMTFESVGLYGLIGFGTLILVPIAAALLMISLLGALIGVFLFFMYALFLTTSFVFSGIFLGSLISKLFIRRYQVSWISTIAGVATLSALSFIPFIGPLLVFVLMLIMLGSIVTTLYKRLH